MNDEVRSIRVIRLERSADIRVDAGTGELFVGTEEGGTLAGFLIPVAWMVRYVAAWEMGLEDLPEWVVADIFCSGEDVPRLGMLIESPGL